MPESEVHAPGGGMIVGALARDLAAWHPPSPGMARLRDDYLAFLDERGSRALDRDGGREHLTSSCFVFTPDRSSVLLCFHRKGRFWVQLGGHIENADASVSEAAFREAVEEGGIPVDPVSVLPVDVDRHALSAGFGRCAVHWDVGFAATATAGSVPVVSDESDDVRWWPVDALPSAVPGGFGDRLSRVIEALSERP
ncbi:NUDIX domain-containing protein [Mycetocola sp. 2940]|uniref:NUDIX hydrolase n=1 Tax=Mycetocola sp. 2940 TaxID=3156452 RepID=UPI0033959BDF